MNPFFEKTAAGHVIFGAASKRHGGKTLEEVAKVDPGYLRWARREKTVGVDEDVFDRIEQVMRSYGIPLNAPRKKS